MNGMMGGSQSQQTGSVGGTPISPWGVPQANGSTMYGVGQEGVQIPVYVSSGFGGLFRPRPRTPAATTPKPAAPTVNTILPGRGPVTETAPNPAPVQQPTIQQPTGAGNNAFASILLALLGALGAQ